MDLCRGDHLLADWKWLCERESVCVSLCVSSIVTYYFYLLRWRYYGWRWLDKAKCECSCVCCVCVCVLGRNWNCGFRSVLRYIFNFASFFLDTFFLHLNFISTFNSSGRNVWVYECRDWKSMPPSSRVALKHEQGTWCVAQKYECSVDVEYQLNAKSKTKERHHPSAAMHTLCRDQRRRRRKKKGM